MASREPPIWRLAYADFNPKFPNQLRNSGLSVTPREATRGRNLGKLVLESSSRNLILDKMMKISREDVLKVAALANLELTDAEVETYRGQLDDILTYIGKLNEIDTTNIEPMTQVETASTNESTLR